MTKRKRKNQQEHTAKHIAWHSFGYQGHYPQQRPTGDGGSLTPLLGTQKYFHVSGDGFFLTSSPYQQDVESRYLQDKKNGVITCLVCGKEGHYSCDLLMKGQEHKIICTVCSKNGHCSLWCCQQNKSESRACTRCGEIGHSTSTHGLSCSSCDEYHGDGECRLSEVKCFICESQDHYLAKCPLSSALTEAFKGQRENFQAALRLALSKQGNPSSTPATCSAESGGKVLTANKSSPICFTCREEGQFTFQCPQNSSVEFEESSTIATSSDMSKVLEEQDPGTAKQSSEMKPKSVVRCVRCGEEGHRPKRCPLRYQYLVTADNTPKPKSVVRCVRCGEEGHRRKRCPFIDNSMPPHMGPRPTGHFGPPAMPSPGMTTPAGFGASSTAKVSVDASLAGGIIGRGGVNTKQISRVTGAKLAIRDHESNEALKNIELEGTFDQINNASAMLRELIFRISGGANAPPPGENLAGGSHRAGGGPGSNFKTKLCDNFTKGSCTFGDRCHFAHGENELRKSAAA